MKYLHIWKRFSNFAKEIRNKTKYLKKVRKAARKPHTNAQWSNKTE